MRVLFCWRGCFWLALSLVLLRRVQHGCSQHFRLLNSVSFFFGVVRGLGDYGLGGRTRKKAKEQEQNGRKEGGETDAQKNDEEMDKKKEEEEKKHERYTYTQEQKKKKIDRERGTNF